MSGSVIKSLLKETIKELPEDFAMNSKSAAAMLLNKGVKPDELEYSQFTVKDGKVTKADMVRAEEARTDVFDIAESDGDYVRYSLQNAKNNPTYREKILTYKEDTTKNMRTEREWSDEVDKFMSENIDETWMPSDLPDYVHEYRDTNPELAAKIKSYYEEWLDIIGNNDIQSRYTSIHYAQIDNYLAHTRVYDDTVNGKSTRVLQEIQSDLHQTARQNGYNNFDIPAIDSTFAKVKKLVREHINSRDEDMPTEALDEAIEQLDKLVPDANISEMDYDTLYYLDRNNLLPTEILPQSPQKKTWLAKGIERELVDAINDGKEQLAIPIKGAGVSSLVRVKGVQRWYENDVLNTAKKVAKRAGADFELQKVTVKGNVLAPESLDKPISQYVNYAKTSTGSSSQKILTLADSISQNTGIKSSDLIETARLILSGEISTGKELFDSLDELDGMLTYAVIKPAHKEIPLAEFKQTVKVAEDELTTLADDIKATADAERKRLLSKQDEDLEKLRTIMKSEDKYVDEFLTVDDAMSYALSEMRGKVSEEGLKLAKQIVNNDNLVNRFKVKMDDVNAFDKLEKAVKDLSDDDHGNIISKVEQYKSKNAEIENLNKQTVSQDKHALDLELAQDRWHDARELLDELLNQYSQFKHVDIFKGGTDEADELAYEEISRLLRNSADSNYPEIREALLEVKDLSKVIGNVSKKANAPVRKNKDIEFYLYSSPVAGGYAVYNAYQLGRSEQEVDELLVSKGKTPEEIERFKKTAEAIKLAKSKGATDEQIKAHMEETYKGTETKEKKIPEYVANESLGRWMSGSNFTPKKKALEAVLSEEAETAKDLLSNMITYKNTLTSNLLDVKAKFGNEEALAIHNKARVSSRNQIIKMMKLKYGVDLKWTPGEHQFDERFEVLNKNGDFEEITQGFWDGIAADAGETVGAIGGAAMGFRATPPIGPYAKPLGAAIGGLIGGVVGSELDYIKSAIELQEDYEAENMAYTALNATEIAIVGEVIGAGAIKFLGTGWKVILRAKDFLLDGNTEGAYRALKETANYTDEELEELVSRLSSVMDIPGKSFKEKAIASVALSDSGMQDLVRAAGTLDPIAGKRVIDFIDRRAKSVLEATGDISTPNASTRFMKDLYNYTGDVKALYNKVKIRATHSPRAQNFEFDYDSIAIDPILEELSSKITDPNVMSRFLLQAQRIKTMTNSRSFADLVELRQLTNDFLFNKRISHHDGKSMLRGVVDRIDDMIEQGAAEVVDDPKQWLNDWAEAKSEYSKMKKLEQTAMFRLVFDNNGNVKPVTPEAVTKAMSKYLTTLDGNFDELLDKLPPQSRKVYEGAIIDTLANKFTVGYATENQVINFPALTGELNKLKFLSPEARRTKDALLELGEIFRNEIPLSMSTLSIKSQPFQAYLTADPVVRAKFAMASSVFHYIKTLLPGQAQRTSALISKTAKLLDNPLNAKTANELIEEFRQDPEMLKMLSQVQRDTAWARAKGQDSSTLKVHIFEGGKYQGSGEPIAKIGRHRIASVEVVQQIADSEAVSINSTMLDSILKHHGYAAVENGTDRVRLLK